jgi:hypothetical protein
VGSDLEKRHLTSPDDMFHLRPAIHCTQVICHRDDRKQKDKEQHKGDQGTPVLLRISAPDCSYPRQYQGERQGKPQEIEKQLHAFLSIEHFASDSGKAVVLALPVFTAAKGYCLSANAEAIARVWGSLFRTSYMAGE